MFDETSRSAHVVVTFVWHLQEILVKFGKKTFFSFHIFGAQKILSRIAARKKNGIQILLGWCANYLFHLMCNDQNFLQTLYYFQTLHSIGGVQQSITAEEMFCDF